MKKKLIWLCIHTLLFSAVPDSRLLDYQQRYSLCHGRTDYQIAECLINGGLNFNRFRGDRNIYRYVSKKKIKEAVEQGNAYAFTMQQMPRRESYTQLLDYLDYLYSIKDLYTPPRFAGDEREDIVRIKRVFNLLQAARLEETPEPTPEFKAALLEYQRRHGLFIDGKIGSRTKRALRYSLEMLIEKVKKNLTLERITLEKEDTFIVVNIPEYKMYYYENGVPVLHMKVVVGKPKMRTPLLQRRMKFIVENPRWNVPPSIYKNEYANKSESELRKLRLVYSSEGKLYQPPGRKNALGLVKFLFPNRFNVYMHDTPAKSLFNKSRRAFSHGCIRLEKPFALLNQLGYTYHPGKTRWITLKEEIPVYIEYHTVWVDDEGIVQFRPDIYGYEKKFFK